MRGVRVNSMPIRKWILQYAIALPIVFGLLAGVQYLKGRDLEYSLEFGLIWSLISVAIFAANRVYIFRKISTARFVMTCPKQKTMMLTKSASSSFQESLSTVFNELFSGSRAFAVWSSPVNISCCFGFKRVYFHLNG
jgi:hypothetical protein